VHVQRGAAHFLRPVLLQHAALADLHGLIGILHADRAKIGGIA